MPKLGDYLGHILSEITVARMHADIESVRVAELYADHPLLKNMPVPRFRMPDIDIDVPVVVKEMEEPSGGVSSHGIPPVADMRKVFDKALSSVLAENRINLTDAVRSKLNTILDQRVTALTRPSETAIDTGRVSRDFISVSMKTLSTVMKPEKQAELEARLNDVLRVELIKIRKPPARLNVLVTTAEIREAGPSEVITHLRLKISEEAFEWTTIESDEGKDDRLIIE
ncbi:hypothetical protein [Sulfurirhabdus autotrophica]|uniref:Uncharacterized protein n=1 Tax=Sulfurirhabdus autotrophica TaxID=1706046 RepID=A0A4R3Y615_9PROT|nr:hypothetical protein [Sulfurirhabdus autotrophica]TCV85904.1 hypothetical protein EDC63_108112 [Sulfurirhabdus autotrophica]